MPVTVEDGLGTDVAPVVLQRGLSVRERRALRRAGGGVVQTRLSVRQAGAARAVATMVRLGMRR